MCDQTSRRNFIKNAAILASVSGLDTGFAKAEIAKPNDKDDRIQSSANSAVTDTNSGKVRGYVRNGILTFKGIPYGADTGGANRFMPPQKAKPWTDVRNCLVYGPICPQKPNTDWFQEEYGFLYQWIDGFQDEDCLRLNVWTPSASDGKKRPVLCWMHGGGFFSGSSQEHPSYDGENLATLGDVVVVSINHRLNAFGHLDLSNYGPQYASSGNVGMLDIVASLQWIQDNIANFGGDKDNVTIFGQSGGGSKVITLMAHTDRCENYTGATTAARQLGHKMALAWINFARHGNPNHKEIPEWPAFSADNGAMMKFNTNCMVKHDPDSPARFYQRATPKLSEPGLNRSDGLSGFFV